MISLQWQDGVLSLLDQAAYPQQEHWITCSTVEETAQALSSGAILEEKIAAVAGVYGYCLAAMAHQELQQTPQFQEKLDQAKALLLASRPGSRELAAALDFMEHPPEAYTKNVDQLTTLLEQAGKKKEKHSCKWLDWLPDFDLIVVAKWIVLVLLIVAALLGMGYGTATVVSNILNLFL